MNRDETLPLERFPRVIFSFSRFYPERFRRYAPLVVCQACLDPLLCTFVKFRRAELRKLSFEFLNHK